jgi:Ca2+-binding RTX toxin-like protein
MRIRSILTITASVGIVSGFTLVAPAADATVEWYCHGVRATIVGTMSGEVINGTQGRDVINGRGGNDTINGRGGNDLICGAYGMDRISGGAGDDELRGGKDSIAVTDEGVSRTGDSLRGGPGDDLLLPGLDSRMADDINPDGLLWDEATKGVTIDMAAGTATGEGSDRFTSRRSWVVGSVYADEIRGSAAADLINGGPGSDLLRGRAGADRIVADYGKGKHDNDKVYGGAGADEIDATRGQDRLAGGDGDDFIADFGNSADVLIGGDGDDVLTGELVDSELPQRYAGGAGVDELSLFTNKINPTAAAATGQWNMRVGELVFNLYGPVTITAEGFEKGDFSTWGTTWTVTGTAGDDTIFAGGTTGTTFHGMRGDDAFMGSAYDDLFDGGPGTDRSLGMGVGNDTCVSVEVFDQADCETTSG